jgi:hypothetical protein
MKEISLHILDIVQNSIQAGASLVRIIICEDPDRNIFSLEITDNGKGMNNEILQKVNDPFFTTSKKKTGLGIPLLKQHCEASEGSCVITSEAGKGTKVEANFQFDHIDRQPLGDITATLVSLFRSYPQIDFMYSHSYRSKNYFFDTRNIKEELDDISIENNEVINFLREMIAENLNNLTA